MLRAPKTAASARASMNRRIFTPVDAALGTSQLRSKAVTPTKKQLTRGVVNAESTAYWRTYPLLAAATPPAEECSPLFRPLSAADRLETVCKAPL